MSGKCSIGVVTYLGRFESYFKPLVRKLDFLFPDYEINVFINGHYDLVKQVRYLAEVTSFLRDYPAIHYVTNVNHQPLARGWNWLILMSHCDKVMILNDDVSFTHEFRHNLESLEPLAKIFMLNGAWGHFVIHKDIIRQVGWFDERFTGVGDEDIDYVLRLGMKGIPLGNLTIHGLENHWASQKDAGWANLSGVVEGKYTRLNREFFLEKWFRSDYGPVPEKGSFKVRYDVADWTAALKEDPDAMPQYYPLECLESSDGFPHTKKRPLRAFTARTCSAFHSFYWKLRLATGAWLRRGFGPQWDEWMARIGRRG